MNLKRLFNQVNEWKKENRTEFILLLGIVAIGAFLRLYKISEYMTFLGDEGRDAIIVRRFLVDFDIILVGPGTSIGNMYLGPLYYYLMAPFLLLFNFSPVGPAVMVALLGVTTIFMIWYIVRQWFYNGSRLAYGALAAAFLYAVSPTVIIYSRSSWNPNIMPFFSLLTIYSIWKFWFEKKYKWILVTGISMAFVLQSHYLGLLLIPTIGIFWLCTLVRDSEIVKNKKLGKWKPKVGDFLKQSIIATGIFSFLMSPLLIFDARHDWRNFNAVYLFFTQRQTTVSARPWTALSKIHPIRTEFLERIFTGFNLPVAEAFSYAILLFVIFVLGKYFIYQRNYRRIFKKSIDKNYAAYFLLVVWIVSAMVGFGLYKQEIYDHYYGIIYAVPFIVFGGAIEYFKKQRVLFYVLVGLFLMFSYLNLKEAPFKYPPNRQLQRSQAVSEKIIEETEAKKFNIAVIADRNYEGAYQYYLERWNAPVVMIDPQRADETITDQLYVICELEDKDACDPTHHPKTEIANFGWSKIDQEWEISGATIYKLVHNK